MSKPYSGIPTQLRQSGLHRSPAGSKDALIAVKSQSSRRHSAICFCSKQAVSLQKGIWWCNKANSADATCSSMYLYTATAKLMAWRKNSQKSWSYLAPMQNGLTKILVLAWLWGCRACPKASSTESTQSELEVTNAHHACMRKPQCCWLTFDCTALLVDNHLQDDTRSVCTRSTFHTMGVTPTAAASAACDIVVIHIGCIMDIEHASAKAD